jgi:hypothetical protein
VDTPPNATRSGSGQVHESRPETARREIALQRFEGRKDDNPQRANVIMIQRPNSDEHGPWLCPLGAMSELKSLGAVVVVSVVGMDLAVGHDLVAPTVLVPNRSASGAWLVAVQVKKFCLPSFFFPYPAERKDFAIYRTRTSLCRRSYCS